MQNLDKLKNILVASCKAIKEGHKDIGLNLLECAGDIMADVDPEQIETQFVIPVNTVAPSSEDFVEDAIPPEEESEDASLEEAHASFKDLITNHWAGLSNATGRNV